MASKDERVAVTLSLQERDLLLGLALSDPELTDRLRLAETDGLECVVGYTRADLEELRRFVAAEADQTRSQLRRRKLGVLWSKLEAYELCHLRPIPPPRPWPWKKR